MAVYRLRFADTEYDVSVSKSGETYSIVINDEALTARIESESAVIERGGKEFKANFAKTRERVFVSVNRRLLEVDIPSLDSEGAGDHSHAGEKDKLYAPMPGKIVKVLVKLGDVVTAKQPLAIVESMKMENQLLSPSDGTVKSINANPGQQVDTDSPIIELDLTE